MVRSGAADSASYLLATRAATLDYAAGPIVGEWVLPWSELPDDLRLTAGHEGKAHAGRLDQQYRPDLVYIHEMDRTYERWADVAIGTAYATEEAWVYEVEPELPIWLDPERGGHLATSRTCRRARLVRCLHWPGRDALLFAIRGATGRGGPPVASWKPGRRADPRGSPGVATGHVDVSQSAGWPLRSLARP